jgi:hypothetical protein
MIEMNRENQFQALADLARSETVPDVDVADRVLSVLTPGDSQLLSMSERPLMWLAALSSTVAVPVAVFAIVIYYASADPLKELVESISWVLQ